MHAFSRIYLLVVLRLAFRFLPTRKDVGFNLTAPSAERGSMEDGQGCSIGLRASTSFLDLFQLDPGAGLSGQRPNYERPCLRSRGRYGREGVRVTPTSEPPRV